MIQQKAYSDSPQKKVKGTQLADKEATHAPWQREFFKNIEGFMKFGVPKDKAEELLTTFLKLSGTTPMPPVMDSFQDPGKLEEVGVYSQRAPHLRDFMVDFLTPLMGDFHIEGMENIQKIIPMLGKFPIVLISNHLSHLDAPAIYQALYMAGGDARRLANSLVFLAGRLAFEPDFTRLALYMIDTLLVCSKKDMSDNPGMADLMTRINMRSFRQAGQLQKEGKVISIFPEGTRSRTGKMINLVDTVYHYAANKIVIPVSLEGTEGILPTSSFLFNRARGKMIIGKPVLMGKLGKSQLEELPDHVLRVTTPKDVDKKRFTIDNLAMLIGSNLHRHRQGAYRNLYKSEVSDSATNTLITRVEHPVEEVVVIGHSSVGMAVSTILANKKVNIQVYLDDPDKVKEYNDHQQDLKLYPLFKLPPNIRFTADKSQIENATLLIQAVPAGNLEAIYGPIQEQLKKTACPIVNVTKGFTGVTDAGLIIDVLEKKYGLDPQRFAVLAGANYPEQIMERKLSGFEIAATNTELVNHLAMLFSTGYIYTRPAINPEDVRGVLLGGALKNIYALGIGIMDGYYEKNLGGNADNSLFHISDRIFKEMCKVGVELGGKGSTFQGLSGHTDLMLGCFGQDSNDRRVGHDFVFGKDISETFSPGFNGLKALPKLLDLTPEKYPVAATVYAVMVQGADIDKTLDRVAYMLRRY